MRIKHIKVNRVIQPSLNKVTSFLPNLYTHLLIPLLTWLLINRSTRTEVTLAIHAYKVYLGERWLRTLNVIGNPSLECNDVFHLKLRQNIFFHLHTHNINERYFFYHVREHLKIKIAARKASLRKVITRGCIASIHFFNMFHSFMIFPLCKRSVRKLLVFISWLFPRYRQESRAF